jgi:hypothetical protein
MFRSVPKGLGDIKGPPKAITDARKHTKSNIIPTPNFVYLDGKDYTQRKDGTRTATSSSKVDFEADAARRSFIFLKSPTSNYLL